MLLALSVLSAGICVATGIAWALVPDTGGFGMVLLALSLLGGTALAAAGWWQVVAGPKTRIFVIVVLAALAGGYVAADTLGLLAAANAPGGGAARGLSWRVCWPAERSMWLRWCWG